MDNLECRVERERTAHTEKDIMAASTRLKNIFCHIWTYPGIRVLLERMDAAVSAAPGRRILDLGCGDGARALRYAEAGATVTGVDISDVYVGRASDAAKRKGLSERASFSVMDAHKLQFSERSFDVVVGDGILHHLHVNRAVPEILRVLDGTGVAVFREPLADHPLLRIFRWLTPFARTEDERPFDRATVASLLRLAPDAQFNATGMISAPCAALTSVMLRPWPNNPLLRLASWVDGRLQSRRWLTVHQYALIILAKRAVPTSP